MRVHGEDCRWQVHSCLNEQSANHLPYCTNGLRLVWYRCVPVHSSWRDARWVLDSACRCRPADQSGSRHCYFRTIDAPYPLTNRCDCYWYGWAGRHRFYANEGHPLRPTWIESSWVNCLFNKISVIMLQDRRHLPGRGSQWSEVSGSADVLRTIHGCCLVQDNLEMSCLFVARAPGNQTSCQSVCDVSGYDLQAKTTCFCTNEI